jgi:hypothetical protein
LLHQLGILDHYEQMFLLFDSMFGSIGTYYEQLKRHPLVRTDKDGVEVPAWDFLLRHFMLLSARQQLFFATGHLFRGHIIEVASHVRRAIEAAGIAYLSKSEPDLGELFHRNDRKEFSRRTPKNKILPESEPLALDLREDIDLANRLTHNNFESLASRMKHNFSSDEKKWSFDFKLYYHEIDLDDPGHFLRMALWMLRVGDRITRLFAASYDLPSSSLWYQNLDAFGIGLNSLYSELDALIRPASLRNGYTP